MMLLSKVGLCGIPHPGILYKGVQIDHSGGPHSGKCQLGFICRIVISFSGKLLNVGKI